MLAFLFALTLNLPTSMAVEVQPALPLKLSVEPELEAGLSRQLPGIVETGLQFVRRFPPKGYENNLFEWSADRGILAGKTFSIHLAMSRSASIAPLIANSGSLGLDALTLAPINTDAKTMAIIVVLLVDKIFYDDLGQERQDGFAKLVLALAHEIYGNVQHFLEFKIEGAKLQTMEDRINQELNAFQASLMFLCGLSGHSEFNSLPEKTRNDLLNLLPAETMAFRSWQRAHPTNKLNPACEAMLKTSRP
jgi:hypothetical protein